MIEQLVPNFIIEQGDNVNPIERKPLNGFEVAILKGDFCFGQQFFF